MTKTVLFNAMAAVAVLACASASGVPREVDGIIAVVEEDVVLASELLTRMKNVRDQMKAADVPEPPNDVLVSQIMERLVIERLQLQQAERRGVRIDDETLTQAVSAFAAQNQMNLEQFRIALARDGVNYREFREQIRQEMLINRLQRNIVNRRIVVSEKDIDDLLASPYYKGVLSDEYRVGHILLTIETGAPESAKRQALDEAKAIVKELAAGADFKEMAVLKSSGARALEGGDLGWRKAGELPSLFAEPVLALEVGQTAPPITSGSGIHVIQLLEKRGAGTKTEDQTNLRHILVQTSEIISDAQAERLVKDIRSQLLAGADFEALARQHSDDPGSALNGGGLGWTSGDEFVPAFQAAMAATATGEFSEPFQSQYGWHVLEILERREQDMSEEARRNMALQILHGRRFEEELQEWLKEIRDEAFVEMRFQSSS